MGFYLQGPNLGKADYLVLNEGARRVTKEDALEALKKGVEAVVCVVSNYAFEAAGYCYSEREFEAFCDPSDARQKEWLVMDLKTVEELTGYQN